MIVCPSSAEVRPGAGRILERRQGARVFRCEDKVIQIRNNYDKGAAGVFNGTVGTVTALSMVERQLTVRTDEDEDIDYEFDELGVGGHPRVSHRLLRKGGINSARARRCACEPSWVRERLGFRPPRPVGRWSAYTTSRSIGVM